MRLFFYGTLMRGSCNPVASALHERLGPAVPARAAGRLFALPDPEGWYPALVPDADGPAVQGHVHEALPGFGPADLAAADAWEGCRSDGTGDYRREPIVVSTAQGPVCAHAYVWNRDVPRHAVRIDSGDFHAFAAERGWPLFR